MKKMSRYHGLTLPEQILVYIFLALALMSAFYPYFNLDIQMTRQIQSLQIPGFSQMMWLVSSIGNTQWIIPIVASIFILLYKSKMVTEAYASVFAALGSAATGTIAKMIIHRPRPDADIVNVLVKLSDKSFPSNHALIFTVYFGFLLFLSAHVFKQKTVGLILGTISTFLILTIGISRIYLGAHWASDVLGGYLLGILFLIFTIHLYKKATNT